MVTWARRLTAAVTALATVAIGAPAAHGHAERPAEFPDGSGSVPTYRPLVSNPHLVVCANKNTKNLSVIADAALRSTNEQLLAECRFRNVQDAVDAVSQPGTTIYVLPGTYYERPYRGTPDCAAAFGGQRILSYEDQLACPHAQNLIGIFGDENPGDGVRRCDGPRCGLQLEGTGDDPGDVTIEGGFDDAGNFAKLNGIRADRADGIYFKNFTIQLFEFNALYTLESDGFVIDHVVARWNDEYGFLTFAVDHGLYENCEGYGNGDSAVYPGSASDVNSSSTQPPPLDRWAVEIRNCKGHDSTLGYSGTAGNSVYAHDNDFYDNATGTSTDSAFPNHPGLPQDHGWMTGNRIHSNNNNLYERYVYSGVCDRRPADRGYRSGTVCPAVLVPVGTGQLIAGGNYNLYEGNDVYDNWRNGFMLFHVPAIVRNETDPGKQFDTSHYNQYRNNRLGFAPGGGALPNGLDIWWDDQGKGNCFQGNVSATGEVTHNSMHPGGLPDCDSGGSYAFPDAPNPLKTSGIATCATYDRSDPVRRRPPGCDWYVTPERP